MAHLNALELPPDVLKFEVEDDQEDEDGNFDDIGWYAGHGVQEHLWNGEDGMGSRGGEEEDHNELLEDQLRMANSVNARLRQHSQRLELEKEELRRENVRLTEKVGQLEKRIDDMSVIAIYKFDSWKSKLMNMRWAIKMMMVHGKDPKKLEEYGNQGLRLGLGRNPCHPFKTAGIKVVVPGYQDGGAGGGAQGVSGGQAQSEPNESIASVKTENPTPVGGETQDEDRNTGSEEYAGPLSSSGPKLLRKESGIKLIQEGGAQGKREKSLNVPGTSGLSAVSVGRLRFDVTTPSRATTEAARGTSSGIPAQEIAEVPSSMDVDSQSAPSIMPQAEPAKFSCDLCYINFPKLSMLNIHKQMKHGVNVSRRCRIGCADCGIVFGSRKEHINHRKTVHGTKFGKKKGTKRRVVAASGSQAGGNPPQAPVSTLSSPRRRPGALRSFGVRSGTTTRTQRVRRLPKRFVDAIASKADQITEPDSPPTSLRSEQPEQVATKIKRIAKLRKAKAVASSSSPSQPNHAIVEPDPMLPEADYKCICGLTFQRRKTIQMHVRRKNRGKIFKCPMCKASFDSHFHVKVHVENVHKEEYAFAKIACGICGLIAFESFAELKQHRLQDHHLPLSKWNKLK